MRTVALIPARGGSERVPDKNTTRKLAGRPLLAYAISAAFDSGCFDKVLVSSDSLVALATARHYGADVLKRPDEFATSTSPDIDWLLHALGSLEGQGEKYDCFAILRVTSPFRSVETIKRAMRQWELADFGSHFDSLRAVEPVGQHPGKMWRILDNRLVPLLLQPEPQPWHSSQMKTLPKVYVQNAALEIAWVEMAQRTRTIAGDVIMPFVLPPPEGFDINTIHDWYIAERMVETGEGKLPEVKVREFSV